jgi:hypothetical protein
MDISFAEAGLGFPPPPPASPGDGSRTINSVLIGRTWYASGGGLVFRNATASRNRVMCKKTEAPEAPNTR